MDVLPEIVKQACNFNMQLNIDIKLPINLPKLKTLSNSLNPQLPKLEVIRSDLNNLVTQTQNEVQMLNTDLFRFDNNLKKIKEDVKIKKNELTNLQRTNIRVCSRFFRLRCSYTNDKAITTIKNIIKNLDSQVNVIESQINVRRNGIEIKQEEIESIQKEVSLTNELKINIINKIESIEEIQESKDTISEKNKKNNVENNVKTNTNLEINNKQLNSDYCKCVSMDVKLKGESDPDLSYSTELYGSPGAFIGGFEPGSSRLLGQVYGPITSGKYQGNYRVGYNLEIHANIEGNPSKCIEQQLVKDTDISIYSGGTKLEINRPEPNPLNINKESGYNSLDSWFDYQISTQDGVKMKEYKPGIIHWMLTPGKQFLPYIKNKQGLKEELVLGKYDAHFQSVVLGRNHFSGDTTDSCVCYFDYNTEIKLNEVGVPVVPEDVIKPKGGVRCNFVQTTT